MSKNKLTIILTLKDRVPFTYRWMRYMNDMRCPHKILIADGGADRSVEENLVDASNYPNLDFEYLRYPYDATINDFYNKFLDVINKVNTEYILMADNDDFYILDRFSEYLQFLDSNPSFVGARGQLINFHIFDSLGNITGNVCGKGYSSAGQFAVSIDSSFPIDRVETLCANMSRYDYYANWYCIFRTKAFQEVNNNIYQSIREVIVNELLAHIFLVLKGKIFIDQAPFYLRQANSSMFGGTLVRGNEFLERCMVNNELNEFGEVFDRFAFINNKDDRERLLRAVATWLEVFIVNIHQSQKQSAPSTIARIKKAFVNSRFGPLSKKIRFALVNFLRRNIITDTQLIREIEPYILK